ncbi:DUF4149 domain-containing protein [Alkalilimnicola sp. S0819]|uniref:DUF4149 domain-containing protein n=1 Tax=Alkalilimnicola sp. S0819 TaxID=2613922 RepID=UPI001869F341|nr:DUF4149 domain-containing protein [Alkalilimnicola sp. S0819]
MPYLGERLALTLWVGCLWAVGYISVPLLQAELPPPVAQALAERLYETAAYLGLACGLFLLFTQVAATRPWWRNWRLWLITLMWLGAVLNAFVLSRWLPGAVSGVHLAMSLLSLALAGFGLRADTPAAGGGGFPDIKPGRG